MSDRGLRAFILMSLCFVATLLVARGSARGVPGVPPDDAPTMVDGSPRTTEAVIAQLTVDRLELFRTGNAGSELSLDAAELTAVVRHALPGLLPAGVTQPVIHLVDGHVVIRVRVAAQIYPGVSPFAAVLDVFPDTLDIAIEGHLQGRANHLALGIDRATAERVPIPRSLLAAIVAAIVRESALSGGEPTTDGGESSAELRLSWPRGIGTVEVVGDRLVVKRAEPFLQRAVDGDGGD
jgi:hypothetical protein